MGQQIFNAIKWSLPLLFVVLIVLIPTYLFLGKAVVKTVYESSPIQKVDRITATEFLCFDKNDPSGNTTIACKICTSDTVIHLSIHFQTIH